jgi:hypothetical protein
VPFEADVIEKAIIEIEERPPTALQPAPLRKLLNDTAESVAKATQATRRQATVAACFDPLGARCDSESVGPNGDHIDRSCLPLS